MQESSEQPGFYKLPMAERLKLVQRLTGLTDEEVKTLGNTGGLPAEVADRMIENVIGGITMPMGVATNFMINGKDYLIPMAIEEPSVVAAASNSAKMARVKGGFNVTNTGPVFVTWKPPFALAIFAELLAAATTDGSSIAIGTR
jgi:hydroxymethylglutaryl-CoA reductase